MRRQFPLTPTVPDAVATIAIAPKPSLPRLTEQQLADRWNISVRTLQAARVKGVGVPFVRIGRSVRYRLEDVIAYEEKQLRTNTSENA